MNKPKWISWKKYNYIERENKTNQRNKVIQGLKGTELTLLPLAPSRKYIFVGHPFLHWLPHSYSMLRSLGTKHHVNSKWHETQHQYSRMIILFIYLFGLDSFFPCHFMNLLSSEKPCDVTSIHIFKTYL
jgi:hypothetical protein